MKKNEIILIIPAYNEEDNILNTVNTIKEYNKNNKTNFEILVVNDGSKDNTEKILIDNNINHIRLINNLGIGGAVQTGYKYAYENKFDIAIQFDGDGQHDINYVKNIIEPILNEEADMVIGSRFIKKDFSDFKSSFSRRMGIRLISSFIKFKTGKKVFDTTSGFRAVNFSLIKKFALNYSLEYPEPISTTRALCDGYKVKEIPVNMLERMGGKSSIHTWKNIYYMINVLLTILLIQKKVK